MKYRAVVVDTNVVVAGLLTADVEAPTARVLDAMASARIPFLLSTTLLAEYREVLLRRRIRLRHGLGEAEVDSLLEEIAAHAIVREPAPSALESPGRGDQHLWDLLVEEPGCILVTGDRILLADPPPGAEVVTPRDFLSDR